MRDSVLSTEQGEEIGSSFVRGERRKKSQTTTIYPDDRNLMMGRFAGDAEQRSVAAYHAARVEALQEISGKRKLSRVLHLHTDGFRRRHQLTRQFGGTGLVFIDDKCDSSESLHVLGSETRNAHESTRMFNALMPLAV